MVEYRIRSENLYVRHSKIMHQDLNRKNEKKKGYPE